MFSRAGLRAPPSGRGSAPPIPAVDKIVGPGFTYVQLAKRWW
jgi:hypothetical protein